jgi:putative transposase
MGGKRTTGRKRHVLVDTLGLLVRVRVLPANISDAAGGLGLVAEVARLFGRLRKLWVDSAYAGGFEDWVATVLGWEVEIVRKLAEQVGFEVQPKRWIVERTQPHCPLPASTVQDAGAWSSAFCCNQR